MTDRHAVVWLDHTEAKVFRFHPETLEEKILHAHHHVSHHAKGAPESRPNPTDAQHFFHEIAKALAGVEEILIVGPGTAKLELVKHVHKHDHELEPKIVGIETVDHPTDGQLAAYARKYFLRVDKMLGNLG